ncbi:helix-turn-helix domain-containing protein [Listeria booriae]|uniref:helix-turn-helix domain-containing protein n=1 Tax=Listeria booriae TaxID=1552123 RepID=UPI001623EE58|nr:helix-turn-helix domain-containing protein [Listeria booriae]MBC1293067.1 helix-turn-helix domain-containing protein [Listeria booriae]MBC1944762.1 helix-turn-helix domain-containing protein [Listeria booriae]MBC6167219.1 helix-turn-helix domain-containing protein [Listeria booriae]
METKHAWIIGWCLIIGGCAIGSGAASSDDEGMNHVNLSNDGPLDVAVSAEETKLLYEEDLGTYLGISDEELAKLQKQGNLPTITIDGTKYYPKASIDKWIEDNVGKSF